MNPARIIVISTLLLAASLASSGQDASRGYYKDVFMDSGVRLSTKRDLPAARLLGLSMEKLVSTDYEKPTEADTINQTMIISGYPFDENGILLYPDGEPRFRMIYVNGGLATQHGRSLGESGRNAIRSFVAAGGSYVGSCAGAFITGRYADKVEDSPRKEYLDIWTGGYGVTTGINDSYTGQYVPDDSPLRRYCDFGGRHVLDSVYHCNGCYACNDGNAPEGTETLMRYVADTFRLDPPIHMEVSCWAYKKNDGTGRVVACGSHPESVTSGVQLDLMASLMRYALDGNGTPSIKGVLRNGEPRTMDRMTHDGQPEYTGIGDRQYHHYCIDVPDGVEELTVTLGHMPGRQSYDMHIFARYGSFAYMGAADCSNVAFGFDKTLKIVRPKAGKLYVSVYCATTVDTVETVYGTQYTGRLDVLNGVPYTITVDY